MKYKQLQSFKTKFHKCPVKGREEICVFQQIIMDNDGKGFWHISTIPTMPFFTQVNGAQIVHWKVDTKRHALVGYTWYNGYGGYNYSSYNKAGVFGWEYNGKFYSFPFSSPPKLEHNTILRTYPLSKRTVTQVAPDLSDLDLEVLSNILEPRIDAELNQHIPKVCRKAWLDFESFDSNLLVELLDTLTGYTTLKDIIPSSLQSFTRFSKRMTKNWMRTEAGLFYKLTSDGRKVLVSKSDLRHFSIPIREIPKLVAAGELEYKYGICMPFKTLSQLWTEGPKDLWASALRHENIMDKIFKPVLRHRENYGQCQISCSIQQSYDVEHLFIELWKALYSSGVLMTFEGIWDFVPLSFVLNWGTNIIKSMVQSLDATTISQMVKVDQYSYSYKYEEQETVSIGGDSYIINLKVYKRVYTRTAPTIGLDLTDIHGNFSIRFLPEAGSLLYLLSSK
jgi:hypothetical protein